MRLRHKPGSGQTPKPTVFPSYLATSWKRQFGRCSCCYTNGVNIVCGFLKKLLYLRQLFSDFSRHQNRLQIWLKHKLLVSLPVSGSVWLWWGRRVCFSNKLPRDPHAAGPRTTLRTAHLWHWFSNVTAHQNHIGGGCFKNLSDQPASQTNYIRIFFLGVGGTKASVLFVYLFVLILQVIQMPRQVWESVIQLWNGWPGAFVECKRVVVLTVTG